MLAKAEKEQCTAFCGRRCRLAIRPGHTTCLVHRNYYRDWCERNPPADHWNDLTVRQQTEYMFQVSRGLVEIPAWQVVLLRINQIDYFDIFMRHTDHSPMLNMQCFTELIFLNMKSDTPYDFLLKDIDSCFHVFKSLMVRMILTVEMTPMRLLNTAAIFLANPSCRCILFSTRIGAFFDIFSDVLRVYMPQWTEHSEAVREMIRCGFSSNAFSIREHCLIYKEDLMKAAWAPSRIEKLLNDEYSIDRLDSL
jgi:hypothetical protein